MYEKKNYFLTLNLHFRSSLLSFCKMSELLSPSLGLRHLFPMNPQPTLECHCTATGQERIRSTDSTTPQRREIVLSTQSRVSSHRERSNEVRKKENRKHWNDRPRPLDRDNRLRLSQTQWPPRSNRCETYTHTHTHTRTALKCTRCLSLSSLLKDKVGASLGI